MLLRSSLALPAMFVLACSGDSGGGGTGATGVGGTNGGGLPGNAPTTLSGTWTGRAEGATGEPGVTIVISGSQFSMRVYNGALDVNAEGEGFHARILEDDGQASDQATVSRKSPEIGNLGAIPLPLAGGLRVQGAEAGQLCQSTLVDGGVTANCGEVDAGYIMPRSRELWSTVQAELAQAGIRGVLRPA